MRALVTGATGFIGRHLVLELRRRGWDVLCMVRTPVEPLDPGIRCIAGDLLRPESLRLDDFASRESNLGSVDTLFHFAARMPGERISTSEYIAANCAATAELLEAAASLSIRSVVYASSLPVIGRPEKIPIAEDHIARPKHPYHLSKLCGEMACEMARRVTGQRVTSLRISSPYGPGMAKNTVISRFVNCALRNEDFGWMGSGSRAQNFVHVSDVVNAALLAANASYPAVYNIGGSETTNMRELANLVLRLASGSQSKIASAGAIDLEEGFRWEVDLARAASGLGYRPMTSLEQGLREYMSWAESNRPAPNWWKS